MHGNQWVLKIAVLKYYSVSKRGTTAKSNPKQATDPISLHTKFGDNSSNTFPLNERKPCVTPDIGRRTPDIGHRTSDIGQRTSDIGHRTSDGEKSKNNISTPQGGGHNKIMVRVSCRLHCKCVFIPYLNELLTFVDVLYNSAILPGVICHTLEALYFVGDNLTSNYLN